MAKIRSVKLNPTNLFILLTFLFASFGNASQAQAAAPIEPVQAQVEESTTPILFIENVGQFGESESHARFLIQGGSSNIWLSQDALWVSLLEVPALPTGEELRQAENSVILPQTSPRAGVNLKLSFPGANPQPVLEPFNRQETHISYFLGNDPQQWRTDVPVWGGVRYKNLYPGIDLEISSQNGQLVQKLVTQPGADLSKVRLKLDGAESMALQDDVLNLKTSIGEYNLPLLELLNIDSGSYTTPSLENGIVRTPFVQSTIRPTTQYNSIASSSSLLYGTYLGGSGDDCDWGCTMFLDSSGAIYLAGSTTSSNLPNLPGAFDPISNGFTDGFIAKMKADGSALLYITYIGGHANEYLNGLTVDSSGEAYFVGNTYSSDFPVTISAFDTTYNGASDVFIARLNSDGSALSYSTFLGGNNYENASNIAVDSSGIAYIIGVTASKDFPITSNAFDIEYNGGDDDAFLAILNNTGSTLRYSTYLGGKKFDSASNIDLGTDNSIYLAGCTWSEDFPATTGAWDTGFNGGFGDGYVAKFNPGGTTLVYATYLGGDLADSVANLAVDPTGAAYVIGTTYSDDFPTTTGAYDTIFNLAPTDSADDAFAAKLSADGSSLIYSTYIGGSQDDGASSIAIDSNGTAYLAGYTYSSNFPTIAGAFDTSLGGSKDAFVVKLNSTGTGLTYSTYLGGEQNEGAINIALGTTGTAYLVGSTSSPNFPTTTGAYDTTQNGSYDAFIAKLLVTIDTAPTVTSIKRTSTNPSTVSSVRYKVEFSEPVSGVDASDFNFTTTGSISGYKVTGISPSSGPANIYTLTVATGQNNGSLRINVLNNGSIKDSSGKPLARSFNSGEIYSITKTYYLNLRSQGTVDGWIRESGENTNVGNLLNSNTTLLRLGDESRKQQYRVILSFQTLGLPDNAAIQQLTLNLRQQGIVGGGNPVTILQGLLVDIRLGFFGNAIALQNTDFNNSYTSQYRTYGPFNPILKNTWYTINLITGKTLINRMSSNGGVTQIRLRFKLDDNNNTTANYLNLYSGNATQDSQPNLSITYQVP